MNDNEVCYVYLMEDVLNDGGVKIGVSDDPDYRRYSVQTEHKTKVALRYVVELTRRSKAFALERKLHKYFRDRWIQGEWFDVVPLEVLAEFPTLNFKAVDLITPIRRSEYPDQPDQQSPYSFVDREFNRIMFHLKTILDKDEYMNAIDAMLIAARKELGSRYTRWYQGEIVLSDQDMFFLLHSIGAAIGAPMRLPRPNKNRPQAPRLFE